MTFPETDADTLESPFEKVSLLADPGSIEISIEDDNKDLRGLTYVSARFVSPEGKSLPVSLADATKYTPDSGTALHKAWFKIAFTDSRYYPRSQFELQLMTKRLGQTYLISGKFSEHHRTQMINLYDALDHG